MVEKLMQRYYMLLHAMQTGIMIKLNRDPSSGSPKHLRVGINARAIDHAALVKLLVDKGVITDEEYCTELVLQAEKEVKMYEEELSTSAQKIKLL
jgi:hypothetical protein